MCLSCVETRNFSDDFLPASNPHFEFQPYQDAPQMSYPSRRKPNRRDLDDFDETGLDDWSDPQARPGYHAGPGHRTSTNHHSPLSSYVRGGHPNASDYYDELSLDELSLYDGSKFYDGSGFDEVSGHGYESTLYGSSRRDASRHHPARYDNTEDFWAGNAGMRYPPQSRPRGTRKKAVSDFDEPRERHMYTEFAEPDDGMISEMKPVHIPRSSRRGRGGNFHGGRNVYR